MLFRHALVWAVLSGENSCFDADVPAEAHYCQAKVWVTKRLAWLSLRFGLDIGVADSTTRKDLLDPRHARALETALTDMGEAVHLGKACFAPLNACAHASAQAGHRYCDVANAGVARSIHRPAFLTYMDVSNGGVAWSIRRLPLLTYMDVRNAGDAWSFRQPPSMAVAGGHPVLNSSLRGIFCWIPAFARMTSEGSSVDAVFPRTAVRLRGYDETEDSRIDFSDTNLYIAYSR
jgi:hypothetical protein